MLDTPQTARPGTLYIVATPIGNLRDITLRALDILKSVDLVAAEDTRVTSGLLAAHGIQAKLFAYHEHNERGAAEALLRELRAAKSVALVSDAGTPGISDPGAYIVAAARAAQVAVVPIPGANAAAAVLSVAGDTHGRWLFHGFLAHKAGERRRQLQALRELTMPVLFYESPHRVVECVADLADILGPERRVLIAREVTKLFENFHECALGEAGAWLAGDANRRRGEFVLLVSGAPPAPEEDLAAARQVLETLLEELPASQAARLAARLTGARKNALYDLALKIGAEMTK
jgi:16S rRNA (cytidine1402-2'-O)-methyltransferase